MNIEFDFINILVTSIASFVVLFFLTKLIGNKQLSEMNLFDYINGITIGSIAAELATSEFKQALEPLFAMIIYGLATVFISWLSMKSRKVRGILSGKATIIMDKGKISKNALKHTKVDLDEFMAMLRVAGYFDLSQIETVIFEPTGRMSILPKSQNRPLTPQDINIKVGNEYFFYNVIMDGKIMENNLMRAGKNKEWLMKELKKQNYDSIKDILLACCDENNTLQVYKME